MLDPPETLTCSPAAPNRSNSASRLSPKPQDPSAPTTPTPGLMPQALPTRAPGVDMRAVWKALPIDLPEGERRCAREAAEGGGERKVSAAKEASAMAATAGRWRRPAARFFSGSARAEVEDQLPESFSSEVWRGDMGARGLPRIEEI